MVRLIAQLVEHIDTHMGAGARETWNTRLVSEIRIGYWKNAQIFGFFCFIGFLVFDRCQRIHKP